MMSDASKAQARAPRAGGPDAWRWLWRKRAAAYWKEAAIYGSYAMRSGLAGLLMLAFIGGSYLYLKALQHIQPDFPYWRVTAPVLALALGAGRVRTFLKEADAVFLMPAEPQLRGYWRRSFAYSYGLHALGAAMALLAVWPLYAKVGGNEAQPFPVVLAAALALRWLALLLRSREEALLHRSHRAAVALLRWAGAAVTGFALLAGPLAATAAAAVLFSAAAAAALRLAPRTAGVPWERLIRQEQALMQRRYLQFSWFADVPQLTVPPKPRRFWARFLKPPRFDSAQTYHYLYAKTFLRSEAFAILLRIATAGVLILLVSNGVLVRSFIYIIAMLMASATVTSLDQAHRYSFWLELYPVPKALRTRAIVRTGQFALFGFHSILGFSLVLMAIFEGRQLQEALLILVLGYVWALLYAWGPLRRRALRLLEQQ